MISNMVHHCSVPRCLMASIAAAAAAFGLSQVAHAAPQLDCPLRDAPYTLDSPLIDVLLNPQAKAAMEQADFAHHLPPMMSNTTPPTFAAIMSTRTLAEFARLPDETLHSIEDSFRNIPVSDADRVARCARYDEDAVKASVPSGKPKLLLFEKINGFRDGPSVDAADHAIREMAQNRGWALVVSDKGGAMLPSVLKHFDAVIWNNVSGDVLTVRERDALRQYIEHGGGFVGFHGSAGDPVYFWDWYVDTLIGARFEGHPMAPQFQEARVVIEDAAGPLGSDLAPGWTMTDEWYSFKTNPRAMGAHVIATLDESSYSPKGIGGQDLHMGDHPIAWTNCVGRGRSFYSAIGHRPETYTDPHYSVLLEHGIEWAATKAGSSCGR